MQRILKANDVTVIFELDDTEQNVLGVQVDGKSRALDIVIGKDDLSDVRIASDVGKVSAFDLSAAKISIKEQILERADKSTKTVRAFPFRILW